MPIYTAEGTEYENEATMLLGSPTEPADASNTSSGSRVPDSTQNSPTASTEAPRGVAVKAPERGVLDKLLGQTGERYQLWPEKLIRSAISAVQAPGEAAQGKLPMWAVNPETGEVNTSPQVIEKANELASLVVLGPAPVAAKLADGTLGSFAGVKSRTFNRENAIKARELLTKGESATTVFAETGFFKGAEGRWKYEIPDDKAKLNIDPEWGFLKGETLGEVLDHPELFKAYPELKNLPVKADMDLAPNRGTFLSLDEGIEISAHASKSTLMHEVQHAIQDIEGFARGGSPHYGELNYDKTINKLREEYKNLLSKNNPTSEDLAREDYLNKVFDLDFERRRAAAAEAYSNYRRLAGEVESYNVETRLDLPDRIRRYLHPERTEDVPTSDQTVFMEPQWATPYGYGLKTPID